MSAHRSAITWHLPPSDTRQQPPIQSIVRPARKSEGAGLRNYHQPCILIQVLIWFTRSYRHKYRLIQKPLPSNLDPYHISLNTPDFSKPFRPLTETLYPFANHYRFINYLYRLLQDLSHLLYILYNIIDISKQVNEGQEKWRQGVDLMSIADVNNYIKFKTLEYEYFKLINYDLWE